MQFVAFKSEVGAGERGGDGSKEKDAGRGLGFYIRRHMGILRIQFLVTLF